MDKEIKAKVDELMKDLGTRELSLDEMDKVSGGSKTFSTGVGSPNGNFGGLCQTLGCGENQRFFIASPEYMYCDKADYMEVDEETFYAYYMGLRKLMPAAECDGRGHESTYAIYP